MEETFAKLVALFVVYFSIYIKFSNIQQQLLLFTLQIKNLAKKLFFDTLILVTNV